MEQTRLKYSTGLNYSSPTLIHSHFHGVGVNLFHINRMADIINAAGPGAEAILK